MLIYFKMWFCKDLQEQRENISIDDSHKFPLHTLSLNAVTGEGKGGLPGSNTSSLLCQASG